MLSCARKGSIAEYVDGPWQFAAQGRLNLNKSAYIPVGENSYTENLWVPGGTYGLTIAGSTGSKLTCGKNAINSITIGTKAVNFASASSDNATLNTMSTGVALGSNAAAGSTTITTATNPGTGYCVIADAQTALATDSSAYNINGQFTKIISVTGEGPYMLTLDTPLDKTYTTANTSKVYKVPDSYVSRNLTIDGISFVGSDTYKATSHIQGMFCDGVTIKNVDFDGIETSAIEFHLSRNITISGVTAGNAFDPGTGGKGNIVKLYKCSGVDISDITHNGNGEVRHYVDLPYCSNVLVHDVISNGGCNANGGEFSTDHGLAGANIVHQNVKSLGASGVGHPTYLSGSSMPFSNACMCWFYVRAVGGTTLTDVTGAHLVFNTSKKDTTAYSPGGTTITRGTFKNIVSGSVSTVVLGGDNSANERGVGNLTITDSSFEETKADTILFDIPRNDFTGKTISIENTSLKVNGNAYCMIIGGETFQSTTVLLTGVNFTSGQTKVLKLGNTFAGTITLSNCYANGVLITNANKDTYIQNDSGVAISF